MIPATMKPDIEPKPSRSNSKMLMAVAASKTTTASRMDDMSMDLAYDHSGSWANSSDEDHESTSPTIAGLASAGGDGGSSGGFSN
jgi:hypothetical protein